MWEKWGQATSIKKNVIQHQEQDTYATIRQCTAEETGRTFEENFFNGDQRYGRKNIWKGGRFRARWLVTDARKRKGEKRLQKKQKKTPEGRIRRSNGGIRRQRGPTLGQKKDVLGALPKTGTHCDGQRPEKEAPEKNGSTACVGKAYM